MSKSAVVFGATDQGLTTPEMTLVVKDMSGVVIATDGWAMTESQLGIYEIDVPAAVNLCTFKITRTGFPLVTYEGFIGGDTATIASAQYAALAKEATLLSMVGSISVAALYRMIRNLMLRAR